MKPHNPEQTPGYEYHPVSHSTRKRITHLGGGLRNILETTGDAAAIAADALGTVVRKTGKVFVSGIRGLLGKEPDLPRHSPKSI